MRVVHGRSSLGESSSTAAMPLTKTNANGGRSSSTQIITRGSRKRFLPLILVLNVVNTSSSPSRTNHTGATCGKPFERTVATFAVRVPNNRNSRHSGGVMDFMDFSLQLSIGQPSSIHRTKLYCATKPVGKPSRDIFHLLLKNVRTLLMNCSNYFYL